jgi:nucleoside-diphosphate-sugar epimerase
MSQQNNMPQQPVLLLTGATGQIGRLILRAWLRTGKRVVITLRDPDRQWPTLQQWLHMQGVSTEGVQCVATDFSLPDFGWGAQAQYALISVTCVVHLAAMWGWQLSWPETNEVNVNGSLRLHSWASQRGIAGPFVAVCGFMSQVPGHLESIGLRQPEINWAYAAKKWGAYEISKLRAYLALSASQRKEGNLPVTWIHPAVVVGDASLPDVPDQSAVAGILNSILRGLLRLVPGRPSDITPWVTGQYVAAYVVAILLSSDSETMEHLLLDPHSPSLRRSVNLMSSAMGGPRVLGHVPKWAMGSMLKLPWVPELFGTSAEALNFVVSTAPDPTASVNWGLRYGIKHPDVMQSLDLTARHWHQKVLSPKVP